MIVITGAAGFIGSNLAKKLNNEKFIDLVLVDDFTQKQKEYNYLNKKYSELIDRNSFHHWIKDNHRFVQIIIHLGARTDTTEFDKTVFDKLNLNYSKQIWNLCVEYGLPLIYASSAATYGNGELGYDDNHEIIEKLKPLNPYGESKNEFDKWVLKQEKHPYFWVGLKFFNVYGPNEYHKGRMASVIFHAYNQIETTGKMKLFRSHNHNFKDGEQKRDFIYVKDISDVIFFFMHHRKDSGIYNLGSGTANSFNNLVRYTFEAMRLKPQIEYIDTPEDIRENYQYFTVANMQKLRNIGYKKDFYNLKSGIKDYVENYLMNNKFE